MVSACLESGANRRRGSVLWPHPIPSCNCSRRTRLVSCAVSSGEAAMPNGDATYGWAARALALAACTLLGCKDVKPPPPPPPQVSVIEVKAVPVTVYNEYVAQTQAPSTIEVRSQVT